MRKVAYIEKFANGALITVDQEDGAETQFVLADDGSAAYRTILQAYDKAAATSTKDAYREPPEPEPPRGEASNSADPEPESEFYDDEDDDSLVGDARFLLQRGVSFIEQNPGLGQFLGGVLNGANSMEAKRHRMKQAERKVRKK